MGPLVGQKLVISHIENIHRELKYNYCGLKITSIKSMNTHIQSASRPPLHKQDFTYTHPPNEAAVTTLFLRGASCTSTGIKYFNSVKIVVDSQKDNQKTHLHM